VSLEPVVIIGAGIGGLTSAAILSARGVPVLVLEKEAAAGGKVRQVDVGGSLIDAGPTVFTMRDVIDAVFEGAGASADDYLTLRRASVLARHAWDDSGHLDLFANQEASTDAIGAFAGADAANGFRSFSAEAKRIHDILDKPMLRGTKVSWPLPLMWRIGLWRVGALHAIRPYESLWKVLGEHFSDPRLRQLFGRYTTYCGSSPFQSPATLMLIAHVEAQGVWAIEGGMSALAQALENVARKNGAQFRYGAKVEEIQTSRNAVTGVKLETGQVIPAKAVICNAKPADFHSTITMSFFQVTTHPNLPPSVLAPRRLIPPLMYARWITDKQKPGRASVFKSSSMRRPMATPIPIQSRSRTNALRTC
jgi:1-hydroxycarotenoid 3,4-desaturase